MNIFNLFKPPQPKPDPEARLLAAMTEVDRLKDLFRQADAELFAAASETYPQGKLIYADYQGYGIIIGTNIGIWYDIDVHVMTYLQPPMIEKNQIRNVKIGSLRVVRWEEVAQHAGYLTWITNHPLAGLINRVNRQ